MPIKNQLRPGAPPKSATIEITTIDPALTQVLERLPDGILLLDQEWRISYANRTARQISRLHPKDINGPTHWELFPDTAGTSLQTTYNEVMYQRVERRLPDFFYEPFSVWLDVRVLPVEGGGIALYYRDVTEQHFSEEARRQGEDQLRVQYAEIERRRRELETIYGGSPVGMALYDVKDLRVLRINDRQVEIFRLNSAEEALGRPYVELAGGVDSAHSLIRRAAAGETILNQDIEGRLDRVPGEFRYWNINYSPIFDEQGQVQAIAAATVETTHQKRAERALIQSEKLAAVGRMASSIAHEINNPLESVTNLIFIARSYAILPEVQHFLDLADQELRRVSIIANQTLRFHKQASSPREITCTDLFATVLSLYEGRLRNSAIKVEKQKRANRPVACFEGDIRQVLNNLVSNAIDAMPMGGRLVLRSRETTDWRTGRKGLALTVADTGKGISKEAGGHIFEAFFTTKGNQGTGLGLWISSEILERHAGRLHFRSSQTERQHGTVFSVFLPFATVPEVPFTGVIQ